MSKHQIIATAVQENHMRACVENIRAERGLSLSALSMLLIGSTRLLDFQRGAPLTQMLLTRVVIGLKAQGLPLTRDDLLGPIEAPRLLVQDEAEERKSVDPLDVCVECLTQALTKLLDVTKQLTTTFGALVDARTPVSAMTAVRLQPVIYQNSPDAPVGER